MQEHAATEESSSVLDALVADARRLLAPARAAFSGAKDLKALEEVRLDYLGKKGHLNALSARMGALSPEERPIAGKVLNEHKATILELMKHRKEALEGAELEARLEGESLDVTLPGIRTARGTLHPVQQVTDEVLGIFRDLGFRIEDGPEVESEWFNFDALNMSDSHPARDMQDTLYAERGFVLRTHTSPVQIRSMHRLKPPMAVVCAGKVYRHDSDATHSPMFHQMEGFLVDEKVSFGHLKSVLHEFLRALYGAEVKLRFRPSFFPFTEPSAEVDVWWEAGGKWLEVLGSGMIHPEVLRNGGIDPEKFSGFAFGLGLDRLACIRYAIPDIRLLYENDVRFLRQF